MVDRWRKDFAQGELPFYLVEIAPYDYGEGIGGALLREAQFRAATTIAHSGIVCTNDLVYPFEKPQIHPCQKREVGNRLAYLALNKISTVIPLKSLSTMPATDSVRGPVSKDSK